MKMDSLFSTSDHYPIVIRPGGDASISALHEYLVSQEADIRALLLKHGGILFRGFNFGGAENFRLTAEKLGAKPFSYVGGDSPRNRVIADVFTSTEYPATEVITLHNEMSYLPEWPSRLFFFSLIPALSGGQTSLANSGDVMNAMSPEIIGKFREKRINYVRNFHSNIPFGKSWQATYQTEDRGRVEEIANGQGSTCSWMPNGVLRVTTKCDAFKVHPATEDEVWFNQAEQWHSTSINPMLRGMFEQMVGKGNLPHECEYGDGDSMEEEHLVEIRRVLNSHKLLFDWQKDDFLMIDNILMMHGRESFKGERKTLAYLSAT
ncbi:MAG: TauD/TfdA family dioxygenase [Lysobacteraceae bacterium]|nr:MAG: TauD/TfdA family dioxygenase [Xanthomonadaceae bacterium]